MDAQLAAVKVFPLICLRAALVLGVLAAPALGMDAKMEAAARAVREELVARHGAAEAPRIERGLSQVLRYWRPEDGDAEAFKRLALSQFAPTGPDLDAAFARWEFALERLDGYFVSMGRDLKRGVDLELGPQLPLDELLAAYNPAAHVLDDAFHARLAPAALLNFPETTLAERLEHGAAWTRRQWAEARLAQRFTQRIPAAAIQAFTEATARAESYISAFNIYMHHVLTADGRRLFPPGMRLIAHWNLRDEIKARYADGAAGLERQRLLADVLERIVRQEIPARAINNPLLDWTPSTGRVAVSPVADAPPPPGAAAEPSDARTPDERYRRWLDVFHAARLIDRHDPTHPTLIERRFRREREIPEDQARALFEAVLASPLGAEVGREAARRLNRPLEPFDIWYTGFGPRGRLAEAELDGLTRRRYPTAAAFTADLPRILGQLGFAPERARYLAERIVVEPSRGAGHALGPGRRDDAAHLRTRVGPDGMDYKGYNIAIHELGHNCEQVFSATAVDHTLLAGVPNNGFTEALAFLFQERDLELLGVAPPDAAAERLAALDQFWSTREIAAVALVDMDAWRWLYEHPGATPAEFRAAVVDIARQVWNRFFATIFDRRDVVLLGVYSHMIDYPLYLPDYVLGQLIAFQVRERFNGLDRAAFGAEFERVTKLGALTPDAWMRQAVGAPLSAAPLLEATKSALAAGGS